MCSILKNSNYKLLGLAGHMGSGKSTVAKEYYNRYCGNNAVILPFAKYLKQFAKLLGWNGEKDDKGRRLLQILGTECMRECIDENGWLKLWYKDFINHICDNSGITVIVDDVRFPNEVQLIRELGGTVVELTGRGIDCSNHPSEQKLSGLMCVDNSKSLKKTCKEIFFVCNDKNTVELFIRSWSAKTPRLVV